MENLTDQPEASTGKFYQFPLALLAFGTTLAEKVSAIMAHATITAGIERESAIGNEEAGYFMDVAEADMDCMSFDRTDWRHRAWVLGKGVVGYYHASPQDCTKWYSRAAAFLQDLDVPPQVRVAIDLFQEVEAGEFDFRDFAVLCAVYAVIGDKKYAIVRRDRVRAGAMGYNSGKVLFNENGNVSTKGQQLLWRRQDKAKPLTVNQCRHTLNKLHDRKFFTRIQPMKPGRTVYYSRSMGHEDLALALVGKMERRASAAMQQATGQEVFREKAAALLKRLSSGGTGRSPEDHRKITTGPTTPTTGTPTTGPTALIPSPLYVPSNEFSSNEFKNNKGEAPPVSLDWKALKAEAGLS